MTATEPSHPTALTIAGSDSGGGAGIQADLKTFGAHQVFGLSVLCALTAQHPREVRAVAEVAPEMIIAQLETLGSYFTIHAAKTGMLATAEVVEAVAAGYAALPAPPPLVVDPVMVATSQARLLESDAVEAMQRKIFPLASLLTPNLDEAAVLLQREECGNGGKAARELYDAYGVPVLVKGGHLPPDVPLLDYFFDGAHLHELAHIRVANINAHGTGCTLSAAIAANLSRGLALTQAVEQGIRYVTMALTNAISLGGERFLNHQVKFSDA